MEGVFERSPKTPPRYSLHRGKSQRTSFDLVLILYIPFLHQIFTSFFRKTCYEVDYEIALIRFYIVCSEWAYFKWAGQTHLESSDIRDGGVDILARDSVQYRPNAHIGAVIDVLSPGYIRSHPDTAAVNVFGQRSSLRVGTMEMVEGEYGNDHVIMSVSMWGPNGSTPTPNLMIKGIEASVKGGLPNIWGNHNNNS